MPGGARRRVAFSIAVLLAVWAAGIRQASADEVRLVNGDRLSGRVVSLSQASIRIATPHSGTVAIDRRHIRHLRADAPMAVDLVSGERLVGRVESADANSIVVHSPMLGDRQLPLDAVAAMEAWQGSEALLSVRGKGTGAATAPVPPQPPPDPGPSQASIGRKPDDVEDIRTIFLRQSSVLLEPGEKEIEIGADYLGKQASLTVLNAKFRQFQIPVSFRFGLLERLEGSLSMPFTHAEQEFSFAGESTREQETGLGDGSLGLNYDLLDETAVRPGMVVLGSLRAPTGGTPDDSGISTGSGHWAASLGVQFIKTVDPIVLFWGVRYAHEFAATHFFNDRIYDVQPGEAVEYNFGFGFAVNDKIALSAQVTGGYQWETEADDQEVPGSAREPVSLRTALTYGINSRMFLEPSVTIGLNDDTPDFSIGLAASRRFGN